MFTRPQVLEVEVLPEDAVESDHGEQQSNLAQDDPHRMLNINLDE